MKERISRKREGNSPSLVQCFFNAITVGSGRHAEPYILAFHSTSDNVAGRGLGTLFGFFEVEIHDEDAAYIVNFLASVAKKEYFANPRRPVSDSFETTLHKINVALAEITQEGNVSWLGHLHGVLGAISDGTVHFSATGDGVLALVRDHTLRPISDGLAEISTEPHPLKTFTEVSSGKLMDQDTLLALSPAVWTLFTPDDLKKNLERLGKAGFEQFLRTALINELPLAGAVIVSVADVPPPPLIKTPPVHKDSATSEPAPLQNVWSRQAFEKARKKQLAAFASPPAPPTPTEHPEEYIDKKTGHIYVQGESHHSPVGEHPWKVRLALWFQSGSRYWQGQREKWSRLGRRGRKNMGVAAHVAQANIHQFSRRALRRWRTLIRHWHKGKHQPPPLSPSTLEHLTETSSPPPVTSRSPSLLHRWLDRREYFLHYGQTNFMRLLNALRTRIQAISFWWQTQSKRSRAIQSGIVLGVVTLGLGIWFYLDRSAVWETLETPPSPSLNTPTVSSTPLGYDEPQAVLLETGRTLAGEINEATVALVTINDTVFAISPNRILNLDTQAVATPAEPIRLATVMDDLDALFLVSTRGTLLLYTPSNNRFVTNTLPLPSGAQISRIGAYLTYLYVLDEKAGTIYRFPRAEGGFGAPITWSKETLALRENTPFTVFENIALTLPTGEPTLYSRGRKVTTTFTGTKTPLTPSDVILDPATGDLLALDAREKRVVRWSPTGTLVAQYMHEDLSDATSFILNKKNELIVARPKSIVVWSLP